MEDITKENTSDKSSHLIDDDRSEKEKYFDALRSWLYRAQIFQQFNVSFPFYFFARQMALQQPSETPVFLNNNYQQQGQWPYFPGVQIHERLQQINALRNDGQQLGRNPFELLGRHEGYEYVIPPLWKRFLAEQLDFIILVFLKLAVTYIAVDYFDFIDLNKYDIETISKKLQEDYVLALEMTSDIILLELIYRFVVCFFEAVCLSINLGGRPGGATPGKAIFGLRVVSASVIVPVNNRLRETVILYPGGGLTFTTSLMRAATKNALIAVLFPVFTLTFFMQHNRTAYDILCNVLVVEENANPPRRRMN